MSTNVMNVQSLLAPILAPVAPAIMFGNSLHTGMIADGVHPLLAGVGAVLGTGGVEFSGALACGMAVMAYHKRDQKVMWVSIVSAIVYAVFVFVGISQARNGRAFAGAVVISLVAYLMQGVYQSYTQKERSAEAETDRLVRAAEAERRLQNSRNRGMKLSNGGQTAGRAATQFRADPELVDAIKAFWQAYPDATVRECAGSVGCSPTTAGKYKP